MRIPLVLFLLILTNLILWGQDSEISFGKITMQINSGEKKAFNIKNASKFLKKV